MKIGAEGAMDIFRDWKTKLSPVTFVAAIACAIITMKIAIDLVRSIPRYLKIRTLFRVIAKGSKIYAIGFHQKACGSGKTSYEGYLPGKQRLVISMTCEASPSPPRPPIIGDIYVYQRGKFGHPRRLAQIGPDIGHGVGAGPADIVEG